MSDASSRQHMLDRLEELNRRALEGGGADRIAKHKARGRLTARERIDALLDPGSFEEYDQLKTHRCTHFGMAEQKIPGDGVVTGHGTIEGRRSLSSRRTSPSSAARSRAPMPKRSARSWIWR
jgi:acetyl-CoA carboxylase carboxyltransferase component